MTQQWPKDNTRDLIAFYGNPMGRAGEASRSWESENLVAVKFPWLAIASWAPTQIIKSARVHQKCAPTLETIFREIYSACDKSQAKIENAGMHLFGGAYNFRAKRGLASLSTHAFGAALDFDPERNGLGDTTPYMPKFIADIFKSHGAVWGGDFRSRKDGMHFQFARI